MSERYRLVARSKEDGSIVWLEVNGQ